MKISAQKCLRCGKCCLSGTCTMSKKIADTLITEGFDLLKMRYPLGNYRPKLNKRGYCRYLSKRRSKYACTLMEQSLTFKKSMLNGHATSWCKQ